MGDNGAMDSATDERPRTPQGRRRPTFWVGIVLVLAALAVLGWAAVLIGGIVIHFFGWVIVDPILSIAISVYILFNAVGTLRKGTGILMQEIPPGIDQEAVHAKLMAIPHVADLHDQHTWTLDGSYIVHTVHVVVADVDLKSALEVKAKARDALMDMGIHHATIELEWADEPCSLEHH